MEEKKTQRLGICRIESHIIYFRICQSSCRKRKRSKGIYISLFKIKLLTCHIEMLLRRQDNNTGRTGVHHLISLKRDVFVLFFHKHARDYSSVSASVGCSQDAGSGLGNYLTAFRETGFLFSRAPEVGGGGSEVHSALLRGNEAERRGIHGSHDNLTG